MTQPHGWIYTTLRDVTAGTLLLLLSRLVLPEGSPARQFSFRRTTTFRRETLDRRLPLLQTTVRFDEGLLCIFQQSLQGPRKNQGLRVEVQRSAVHQQCGGDLNQRYEGLLGERSGTQILIDQFGDDSALTPSDIADAINIKKFHNPADDPVKPPKVDNNPTPSAPHDQVPQNPHSTSGGGHEPSPPSQPPTQIGPEPSTALVPYDPEFASQQGTRLLQSVANDQRAALGMNPAAVRNLLTAAERDAMTDEPWLVRPMFGKAIERAVAADPRIAPLFDHLGGAGEPDFMMGDYAYELTTSNPGTIAAHLTRPYVDPTRLITYDPIQSVAGF